jgi:hypothetical protein
LRDEAPYIDDAGFTARVMQQLPAARPRYSFRNVLLICLTLLGSVLTYIASSGGKFIGVGIDKMASLPTLWILTLALLCSVAFSSIATAAAIARIRSER